MNPIITGNFTNSWQKLHGIILMKNLLWMELKLLFLFLPQLNDKVVEAKAQSQQSKSDVQANEF